MDLCPQCQSEMDEGGRCPNCDSESEYQEGLEFEENDEIEEV